MSSRLVNLSLFLRNPSFFYLSEGFPIWQVRHWPLSGLSPFPSNDSPVILIRFTIYVVWFALHEFIFKAYGGVCHSTRGLIVPLLPPPPPQALHGTMQPFAHFLPRPDLPFPSWTHQFQDSPLKQDIPQFQSYFFFFSQSPPAPRFPSCDGPLRFLKAPLTLLRCPALWQITWFFQPKLNNQCVPAPPFHSPDSPYTFFFFSSLPGRRGKLF